MLLHRNVYLAWVMNHSLLEGVHFTCVGNLSLLMSAVWINTLFVSSISWCRGHPNDWGCVKWMLIINGSWPLHRLLVMQLNTFYNIWNQGGFLPLHTTMLSLGNRIRFPFIGVFTVFWIFYSTYLRFWNKSSGCPSLSPILLHDSVFLPTFYCMLTSDC